MQFYQLENRVSFLRDIAWKTKAAVDRHTAGSMLLQRNTDFALMIKLIKNTIFGCYFIKEF